MVKSDDLRKAEKRLREIRDDLGMHLLFGCDVVGFSIDRYAYEVNFMRANEILRKEFIPRSWLEDRGPNVDLSPLHDLLRKIEQAAK